MSPRSGAYDVNGKSKVSIRVGFYNISGTNKVFVLMYAVYAFCILKCDRYRDVSLYNCLAIYRLSHNCCIMIISLSWASCHITNCIMSYPAIPTTSIYHIWFFYANSLTETICMILLSSSQIFSLPAHILLSPT